MASRSDLMAREVESEEESWASGIVSFPKNALEPATYFGILHKLGTGLLFTKKNHLV